ncbi:hypothetical protein RRG08_041058 [Elysia crispata]|uniref:Uncharacterized protein n=1 Tax=Elysia crispata TaxID=231223 RepID=A0AAE0Y7P7_9GAST|nr:hypothetical protein RRG08_041058 [Elysia crispata]
MARIFLSSIYSMIVLPVSPTNLFEQADINGRSNTDRFGPWTCSLWMSFTQPSSRDKQNDELNRNKTGDGILLTRLDTVNQSPAHLANDTTISSRLSLNHHPLKYTDYTNTTTVIDVARPAIHTTYAQLSSDSNRALKRLLHLYLTIPLSWYLHRFFFTRDRGCIPVRGGSPVSTGYIHTAALSNSGASNGDLILSGFLGFFESFCSQPRTSQKQCPGNELYCVEPAGSHGLTSPCPPQISTFSLSSPLTLNILSSIAFFNIPRSRPDTCHVPRSVMTSAHRPLPAMFAFTHHLLS